MLRTVFVAVTGAMAALSKNEGCLAEPALPWVETEMSQNQLLDESLLLNPPRLESMAFEVWCL